MWCNGIQGIYAQLAVGVGLPVDLPNLSSWTFRCGHHRGLFASCKTNNDQDNKVQDYKEKHLLDKKENNNRNEEQDSNNERNYTYH